MTRQIDFSEIEGIRVGHAQNLDAATGCSVIICEAGASVGVDVRGGAPGTRETDLLNPVNLVQKVHAVMLAGGSAFGLDAAAGVMQYLEERGIGFDVQVTRVPIVCGAVLFDLTIGDWRVRPDKDMGYQACVNAGSDACIQGSIGAGTGATVGKILGMERAMKSGLGCYALQSGELKVGALVAVNCLGDILDPLYRRKAGGSAERGHADPGGYGSDHDPNLFREKESFCREYDHRHCGHQCGLYQSTGHQAGFHGSKRLRQNHAARPLHV